MKDDIPHYIGHRQRLRQRIIVSAENLADYELLEMILFSVIPRKDVKPLAKELLTQFGSLANLINTDKEKLLNIKGTNDNLYVNFVIMRELTNRMLKQKVVNHSALQVQSLILRHECLMYVLT